MTTNQMLSVDTLDYIKERSTDTHRELLPLSLVRKALNLSRTQVTDAHGAGELSISMMKSGSTKVQMVSLTDVQGLYLQKIALRENVTEILLECWAERQCYTFGNFLEKIGYSYRSPRHRKVMREALRDIDREYSHTGVLLSSIIYLAAYDMPAMEYFNHAVELGLCTIESIETDAKQKEFWDDQLLTGWSMNLRTQIMKEDKI